jgi:sRNA-binding regulator protein Hfq
MRKKISFHTLIAILLIATTAQADTIRLKNGSVIKGKVTSFSDDQFVVMLDSGSGRSMSKAMIYIADIAKIDFDAAASGTTDPTNTTAAQPEDNTPRNNSSVKEAVKETPTPPVNPVIRGSNPKNNRKTDPKQEVLDPQPETTQPEKTNTASDPTTSVPETRKPLGPNARTVNVEVAAKRDWTSSGVIVKRGDRIRITATGNITIDPAGQSTGPDGIESTDSRKLMGEKPTGGLIGVIGADNDDFVFIGKFTEFTATRDGLLFLSVNEGTLSDNSGSFKAVIEIQAQRQAAR